MVHLYSAFIQGALHCAVHSPIHTPMVAETMQGTNLHTGSNLGFRVLPKDSSTVTLHGGARIWTGGLPGAGNRKGTGFKGGFSTPEPLPPPIMVCVRLLGSYTTPTGCSRLLLDLYMFVLWKKSLCTQTMVLRTRPMVLHELIYALVHYCLVWSNKAHHSLIA